MAAIVYASDNIDWVHMAVGYLRQTIDRRFTDILVIDNGSRFPYAGLDERTLRYDWNIGGNAVFHRWMTDYWFNGSGPEFLAFFHCDLMVHEHWWDHRVLRAFDEDPRLALIGFVGSNEIDELGGRGGGTMLNFIGSYYDGIGVASPAEAHGERMNGLRPAAVVDHCAMIFRTSVLRELTPQEGSYAPEHFYDRILSCEVLQRGEHIAVLGIGCDHFSGGIGDGMEAANDLRRKWLDAEGIPYDPADTYGAVYVESERRFFAKYKGYFPLSVDDEYVVHR